MEPCHTDRPLQTKDKDTVIGTSRRSSRLSLLLPENWMRCPRDKPVTAACGHLLGQLKSTQSTLSGGLKAEQSKTRGQSLMGMEERDTPCSDGKEGCVERGNTGPSQT